MLFQNQNNVQNMKKNKNSKDNSHPLYKTYTLNSLKNSNLKVDQQTRMEWFIHGSKHHKENPISLYGYYLNSALISDICSMYLWVYTQKFCAQQCAGSRAQRNSLRNLAWFGRESIPGNFAWLLQSPSTHFSFANSFEIHIIGFLLDVNSTPRCI